MGIALSTLITKQRRVEPPRRGDAKKYGEKILATDKNQMHTDGRYISVCTN
jgi:hypothetical protein